MTFTKCVYVIDSVESASLDDAVARSILPEARKPRETATEKTSVNSKHSVAVNKEGYIAEKENEETD